ncbi:MAG TPA: transcription antitermination factor NusB [Hyphomicrobiaceae bacterium]|jgi:N utilization substance protein B|nr:transcription antitermination factor NusB [Hyphomicrobiaceae bacterium]
MSDAGKSSGKSGGKSGSLSRSRARLAAVQALYQMDLAETDLGAVLQEFSANPLVDDAEANGLGQPDADHLARVLKGVVARQREIDPLIDQQLATGWRLVRIDSIVRAILRAAAFELIELADVPARVVISEYVEVANAFFEGDEPKVVNGVLDQLARKLREGELPPRG